MAVAAVVSGWFGCCLMFEVILGRSLGVVGHGRGALSVCFLGSVTMLSGEMPRNGLGD